MARSHRDAPRLSWERVHAFRVSRHHLARPGSRRDLAAIAGDIGGVQAQVPSAASLALRARVRGLRPEDVDRALAEDRTLVEATCMRGTRHFVPSQDLAVFLHACDRRAAQWTTWFVRKKWPMDTLERILRAMGEAMDEPRTKAELVDHVRRALRIPTRMERLGHGWGNVKRTEALVVGRHVIAIGWMVVYACHRGIACCGPDRDGEATFVRPDAWVSGYREVPAPDAKRELVRRYLHAYGPATPEDMAAWSGFGLTESRSVWAGMADELAEVALDGQTTWILREDLPELRRSRIDRPLVRLLPYFDTYVLGHRKRDHLMDARHHSRVSRPAGIIAPTVLVDGRVEGTWRHERKGGTIKLRVEPFSHPSREVKEGIDAEAQDIGRFLGTPADVAYSFG